MSNLIRFTDPFAGLSSLHGQLDDMFNSFFGSTGSGPSTGLGTGLLASPAMDVYADGDKQLVAEVHVPGFKKDDIDVSVNQGVLEIRGQRRESKESGDKKERNYMLRESSASFYRRLVLPKQSDGDNVSADFTDGVLKITVPLKELPGAKEVAIGERRGADQAELSSKTSKK